VTTEAFYYFENLSFIFMLEHVIYDSQFLFILYPTNINLLHRLNRNKIHANVLKRKTRTKYLRLLHMLSLFDTQLKVETYWLVMRKMFSTLNHRCWFKKIKYWWEI